MSTANADRLFKVLGPSGEACNGGVGVWHLPNGSRPGKWMPPIKGLEPCSRGYHIARGPQILQWLGPTLWEVEVRGDQTESEDKLVVEQARLVLRYDTWNDRTARLFAADCAEAVLPIFERYRPDDLRPRHSIEVTRRYALGGATERERAAAGAAAVVAARDAARAAAWAAARDAQYDHLLWVLSDGYDRVEP